MANSKNVLALVNICLETIEKNKDEVLSKFFASVFNGSQDSHAPHVPESYIPELLRSS